MNGGRVTLPEVETGQGEQGFTLIEALAALLILTLVLMSSLLVFFERQKRLQIADQSTRAWQVLANEAEGLRYRPFDSFVDGTSIPFVSDPALLDGMSATTSVEVVDESPVLKRLILRIEWSEERFAMVELLRSKNEFGELW